MIDCIGRVATLFCSSGASFTKSFYDVITIIIQAMLAVPEIILAQVRAIGVED